MRGPLTDTTTNPRRHGDLRNDLIEAGIALLNERGQTGLTLRQCAARAGVSHAAPAHHFAGLPGLIAGIVERGFERFSAAMVEAREGAGPDPRDRLIGICEGYLQFADTNEALFELMFMADSHAAGDPGQKTESMASYQVLAEACAPFSFAGEPSAVTELTVWSLVQGFATLSRKQRLHADETLIHDVSFADLLPPLSLR